MLRAEKQWPKSVKEIDVGKFAESAIEAAKGLSSLLNISSEKEAVKSLLNLDDNSAQLILDDMDVESLRCDADLATENKREKLNNPRLTTLKLLDKKPKSKYPIEPVGLRCWHSFFNESEGITSNEADFVAGTSPRVKAKESSEDDVVLTMLFYRPSNKPFNRKCYSRWKNSNFDCSFYVLGSQRLVEVRDNIFCPSDMAPLVELKPDSDLENIPIARDAFPGAFFYINQTFYNDLRQPHATDLSEPILSFLSRKHSNPACFRTAKMEETKFNQLKIRIGEPYVYVHQGHCEHLFVFSDIHLIHSSDPQDRSMYPLRTRKTNKHISRCNMCKQHFVDWKVELAVGDSPFQYNLLCKGCFKSFCLDENGEKVRDFALIPFYHRYTE
ncbi:hypothetical protein M514_08921 [Trichuris suis]|uniref:snRNA-activating protein complex subunit 3 n=1 Tax=Trichuris suis TaxID=68888 RepID=A0A085LYY0_9BILA|nr:hypothetical protein M513_08921 [Trichuris suis]KFD70425.1 hypothetical protein M514_08921 [Trichuris suis]KHJ47931.1 hypothetical protein D918_02090 [Trichuris suis]